MEGISNAEKTRSEFETVSKLSHPNILKVVHVFRHQKTKKQNNIRSLENRTIIVMEKHDKNIGELTTEERIYLPGLLQNVLGYVQFIYLSYRLISISRIGNGPSAHPDDFAARVFLARLFSAWPGPGDF